MLYRLRRELRLRAFNRTISGIMSTPPMPVVDAPLTIVSMVSPEDVPMYILGMKAFYRRIGRGRLVAIVARTVTAEAREQLRRHFPGIEFQQIEEIDVGICQRGGCWERLMYIATLSADRYVLQVDADILPIDERLEELQAFLAAGTPFTLVDGVRRILTMREVAEAAKGMQTDYIGVACERLFDRYPGNEALRYVRGSAALAGFAAGGVTRARVEEFHARMEELIGPARWREWGTEQCASNFSIANSPGAALLPYPSYTSFFPGSPREGVKLFHFMGSFRFDEGVFARHAQAELARLSARSARSA